MHAPSKRDGVILMSSAWSESQTAELNECVMRGIGPSEAAALIGKTKDEVCTKMRELGSVSV